MSHLSLTFGAGAGGDDQRQPSEAGRLDVRHVAVVEGLSQPFLIHLVARSPSAELDPGAHVGRDVTFRMDAGAEETRAWSGVVMSFELTDVEEGGLSTYELSIAPRLALLDHRVNCRIFQQKSAVDIATELLAEWAIDHAPRLTREHTPLEYRVQYHESDLGFLHRILSEAGISYWFEEAEGATRLVLCDGPERAEASRAPLPYRASDHDDTDAPHVRFAVARKEIRHAAVTLGDFDFRRPGYGLVHTAERADGPGGPLLEQYVYRPGSGLSVAIDGGASDTPAADARSRARVDEHQGRAAARAALEGQRGLFLELQSNVTWLAPGTAFLVAGHPRLGGKRLVVTEARLTGDSDGAFSAAVAARHGESAIRPAPVVRPTMPGLQSAVVVGAPGEEIHTDEFGRVRVHFHWDRAGEFDDKSSCWLRVVEGWGGAGFGLLSLPRVGHEVLVDFVAGNPDEPVVVGRAHGGTTPPYVGLPGNQAKTGWRTRSTPDGDGFHEITFEDKQGKELLFVRSQRDLRRVVQRAEDEIVGRDRVDQIGGSLTTSIAEVDAITASAMSAAMGKVSDIENIQAMGAPTVGSTLTLREMVPGKITLTTGGALVQLLDDEIFVVADDLLRIQGKQVVVQGGPFVHVNPPGQGEAEATKKDEQAGHVVWFELRDKGKKPLPNVACRVASADGATSHVQKTDGQGRVLFHVDKPGDYHLVVGKEPEETSAPKALEAAAPGGAGAAAKPSLEGNQALHINRAGLKLIRKSESFSSNPYVDPVGIPTIGYGTIEYPDGRAVTMKDAPITEAEGEAYLRHEVASKEDAVKRMVKVPLNENQMSALTSFAYNVGTGALKDSTLLKKLNAGDYDGAASEFGRWNKGKDPKTGKKVELGGLTKRRAAERALFEKPAGGAEPAAKDGAAATAPATGAAPATAPAPKPKPVQVGTTAAKPTARAQMTKHTVPLEVSVVSPAGSEKLTIEPGDHPGADPAMPTLKLKASATLSGQPVTEGTFRWQLWLSGNYKTRMGQKPYNLLAGDARTQPGQEVDFKLAPPSVAGGTLEVKVQLEHPELGTTPAKTVKGVQVQGKNPSKAAIQALVKEIEPGMGWLLFPILQQESRYRQFKSPDEVLVGAPAGIGITQRDPTTKEWGAGKLDPSQPNVFFPRIYWDWKENVRAGMTLFREKQAAARRYLDGLQKKHGLPAYTDGMLARETLRRYNGGAEYNAKEGQWAIDPRTKDKSGNWVPLPADRAGYVDEVIGRMDAADIPAGYADVTKKDFP